MVIRLEWGGMESRSTGEKTEGIGKEKERRRTGCHKFKQQLTFRVKACGNGPLAMRICNAVSAERSAALCSTRRSSFWPSRRGFTRRVRADANR